MTKNGFVIPGEAVEAAIGRGVARAVETGGCQGMATEEKRKSVIQEPTLMEMVDLLIADAKGLEAEEQRKAGLWDGLGDGEVKHGDG